MKTEKHVHVWEVYDRGGRVLMRCQDPECDAVAVRGVRFRTVRLKCSTTLGPKHKRRKCGLYAVWATQGRQGCERHGPVDA